MSMLLSNEGKRPARTGPTIAISKSPVACWSSSVLITVKPGTERSSCHRPNRSRGKPASSVMIKTTGEWCTGSPLLAQSFGFFDKTQQALGSGGQIYSGIDIFRLFGLGNVFSHLINSAIGNLQGSTDIGMFMFFVPLNTYVQDGACCNCPLECDRAFTRRFGKCRGLPGCNQQFAAGQHNRPDSRALLRRHRL